jgi:hypothetical protein
VVSEVSYQNGSSLKGGSRGPSSDPNPSSPDLLGPVEPGNGCSSARKQAVSLKGATQSTDLCVGDVIQFPTGFWDDAPNVAVCGRVIEYKRREWRFQCLLEGDDSTLIVPNSMIRKLLNNGQIQVIRGKVSLG